MPGGATTESSARTPAPDPEPTADSSATAAAAAWVDLLERSSPALVRVLSADEGLRKEAEGLLAAAVDAVGPRAPRGGVVTKELVNRAVGLAKQLGERDKTLENDLARFRQDVERFAGKSLAAGLKELDRPTRRPPA